MAQTGIDIVDSLWATLNVPSVTSLIDGSVWKHNRPRNSAFTDVVISVPEYKSGAFNTGRVDVNIHSPNLKEYYPYPGGLQDTTFPDLSVLRDVVDAIMPLLTTSGGYSLYASIPGVPIRDADGHWYANIGVSFEIINTDLSVPVQLVDEVLTPDGYGGVYVAFSLFWSGVASQLDIKEGDQDSIRAEKYVLNMKCGWLLPKAAMPQKGMLLVAPDGEYALNGISPHGDRKDFWMLSTTRKDADFV